MTQVLETQTFKTRVKTSQAWWARLIRWGVRTVRYSQMPTIIWLHRPLWWLHHGLVGFVQQGVQQLYYTPLFKARLRTAPKQMQLYSGMPQVGGALLIDIGERCRISGISSLFGRASSAKTPELCIGDNVDIGWQCTLAVGRNIVIGDNVRLAGRCYLAGFPGHPEDPFARAQGLPETDQQVGDITLEENVWLATGVTVLAGVTIGKNSIIGTGSVVTQDIPPNVVAAGIPAKVIRPIRTDEAGDAR